MQLKEESTLEVAIAIAQSKLRAGGVVIFPTETIYGIGCDALNAVAIEKVFAAKERAPDKPPPVLIADFSQVDFLVAHVPDYAFELMQAHWPGALTLVLPAQEYLPASLTGCGEIPTIGVRHTSNKIAQQLAMHSPLVATSANLSGVVGKTAAPNIISEISEKLLQRVDCVVDGGALNGTPSTVVDCTGEVAVVLRAGAVAI